MKLALIASTLASLAMAASQTYFSATAASSNALINGKRLTASTNSIWIGKPTAKYCPPNVQKAGGCPVGLGTDFIAGENGTLDMGAGVPGGQQVYINRANGAVRYTIAHSGATGGGITNGWTWTPNNGHDHGTLKWSRGLIACPSTTEGVYKIFANLQNIDFSPGCIGPFSAVTSNISHPNAWQYQ